jgi:hypothetical protein
LFNAFLCNLSCAMKAKPYKLTENKKWASLINDSQ